MKIKKHNSFLGFFTAIIFTLLNYSASSQPDLPGPPANLQTVTQGALVIPMDNNKQNIGTPFNLKAYGLVHALLMDDIPVKWVIKSGKAKDAIDFSATAERLYPSFVAATTVDFRASAFIVDSTYINNAAVPWGQSATQVITSFGNNVAVFRLTQNVTVDVRYTLDQRPKIAVFNNGGNQLFHTSILDSAGVTNYVIIDAGVFTGLAECYTFCSEAHWKAAEKDTTIMQKVEDFVYSGGNFFAQCHSVQTGTDGYEANMLFQTTAGFDEIGINTTTNSYYNVDLAYMQFHGLMQANEGGSGKNWRLKSGSSYRSGFYRAVNTENSFDTLVATGAKLTLPIDTVGGNVYYLGGHNYGNAYTDLLIINAARLYLNASLVPSARPTPFTVGAGTDTTICLGDSVVLGGSPTGPAGTTYAWSPAATLDDSTKANPKAAPSDTTLYVLNASNGGCTSQGAVKISVVPLSTVNAGPDTTICSSDSLQLSGTVTNASGGVWTGGTGTFDPNDSTLNAVYIPSAAEVAAGSVQLILTSYGTTACAITKDSIVITILPMPTFTLDLTGDPDSVWLSPSIKRDCQVCGATAPDQCVEFIVTLDLASEGISFDIASGAVPPGALFYQINCGPPIPVGDTICLNGPGPHQLTFCKPGNNPNVYSITAIPAPDFSPPITVNDGCSGLLYVTGFDDTTITWTSVFPGAQGTYDSYLNCTADCDTVLVTAQPGFPDSVDYQVCGFPVGGCNIVQICDTIRVYFNSTLAVSIQPDTPTVCFGSAGTTITANSIGGTPPYSYSWSTGETTQSIFVNVGTYIVTLSDTSGCPPTTDTVVVTSFLSAISANAGADQTVCTNNIPLSLTGLVTGVTNGIWSGGGGTYVPADTVLNTAYTPSAAEITAGSAVLYLTTTGNGSCPADTDTILISIIPGSVANFSTDTACLGDSTFFTDLSASSGTGIASWLWVFDDGDSSIISNPAHLYSSINDYFVTLTITDSNGCSSSFTDTAVVAPAHTTDFTFTNACLGDSTVFTDVSTNSGSGSIVSWFWDFGDGDTSITQSPIHTYIDTGTYTVTLTATSSGGCTRPVTYQVPVYPSPAVAITSTNITCNGLSDGTGTVTPSGGSTPYSYQWDVAANSQTTPTATGLAAGVYWGVVIDSNGCKDSTSAIIINPPILIASISGSTNVSCNGGNNGSAALTASGGTTPYSYQWDVAANSQTDSLATGLSAGTYFVTVIDSMGCLDDTSVTITQPTIALASSTSATNVSCNGGNDGTATDMASGGTTPYSYQWDAAANSQTTATATGLNAGTYNVTITDNNGCLNSAFIVVNEAPPISLATDSITVSCLSGNDGSATLITSGGATPYSYLWDAAASSQTSSTATGLSAGTYIVTLTDGNGCIRDTLVIITEPNSALSATTSATNAGCFAGNNGTATANPSGGVSPYFYLWDVTANSQTTATATGLIAGTYNVTITDSNGCIVTAASATVNEPTEVTVSISTIDATCSTANGSATVSAAGGTSPYSYLWGNGQTTAVATGMASGIHNVTITDNNGCVLDTSAILNNIDPIIAITDTVHNLCFNDNLGVATITPNAGLPPYSYTWADGQTDSTATGLAAGLYYVTVTDNNSCIAIDFIFINEPPPIALTTDSTTVSCNGLNNGSATLTTSGGTTPYSYQWDAASGSQTNSTAVNLSAGTYNVTMTDNNGCTADTFVTVIEPTLLNLATSFTDVTCKGFSDGTTTATPSGGISPYNYQWDAATGSQTDSTATGLVPGTYNITVSDANNCTDTTSVTVSEPVVLLSLIAAFNDVNCFGNNDGDATATLTGGATPYSYQWDSATNSQTNSTATGLIAGVYSVTVTDNNNCIKDTTIIVSEPTLLTVALDTLNASCGLPNGSAAATPSGGMPSYSYIWSNSQTDSTATGLNAGLYGLTITDNNGCLLDTNVILNNPQPFLSITDTTHLLCFGDVNGTAIVTPNGGLTPYTYTWDNGQTDSSATGLVGGPHYVTVTDNNGCLAIAFTPINQPPDLILQTDSTTASCNGLNDGSATITASGGTTAYSYLWDVNANSQITSTATGLAMGTYNVTVTDNNSCTKDTAVTVTEPVILTLAPSFADVTCNGGSDGAAMVTASGGTTAYSYQWDDANSQTNFLATGLPAGIYNVTTTDANNCTETTSVTISEPTPVTVLASNDDTICPNATATISAAATGGSGVYDYLWDNGSTVQSLQVNPSQTTTYYVTSTDSSGCQSLPDSVTIYIRILSIDSILMSGDEICIGENATITGHYNGSLGPYFYVWSHGPTDTGTFTVTPLQTTSYSLTVTDMCGNSGSNSITVIVNPLPEVYLPDIVAEGCEPLTVSLADTLNTNATYIWDFGDGSTATDSSVTHPYPDDGTYQISLSIFSSNNCSSVSGNTSGTVTVFPIPEPVCSAEPPSTDTGSPISFETDTGVTWAWQFGDGDSSDVMNPTHIYADTGNYNVNLNMINQYGCENTCSLTIRIYPGVDITVPNAFIPNPNGSNGGTYDFNNFTNEVFIPVTDLVKNFHMMIFNRWGEMVFETFDINIGWDGYYKEKLSQQDVYVWKIDVIFNDDFNTKWKGAGDVTLIR